MRLLYLNHNVVRTGTFVRAANFAREAVAAGHEVTLVTTSRELRSAGREWHWHGVHVIEAPDLLSGAARTGWDAWNTAWRVRRLAAERFDLIHAFDCRPAVILPALAVRRKTGAPLVLDWADWWGRGGTIDERSGWLVRTFFGPVETWFEEAFRVDATAHTTIVETLSARCAALGVDPARIRWLPNGCASPDPQAPDRAEARQALGLDGSPILLYVGAAFQDDARFLFDAFREIRRELPAARLVLVGASRVAVPGDLAAHVVRTGFVDDATLRLWLAAADAGALILRDTVASRGRWPGKLSDYLSAGVPIVMTNVGAAAAYLEKRGAAVFAPADVSQFAAAAVGVMSDPGRQAALGRRGIALAAGELGWRTVTRELLAFYARWLPAGDTAAASARVVQHG